MQSYLAKGEHEVYVAGLGSFLPGDPVPFTEIETVLGKISEAPPKIRDWIDRMRPIMEEMLGVETCYYAIDPQTREPTESNVTMSVKAAEKAMAMAGITKEDIDLMVYAGVLPENICPPTTVLIQEAMGISDVAEYSIHSNCTSIYKAIQLAADQIALGRYKMALIMTSQLSSPMLRAEHYNQKVLTKPQILLRWFLSDGAGAIVLTSDPTLGRKRMKIIETYTESIGLGEGPDMYCIMGGHRVNMLEAYEHGWHHLTQNFERVARLALELGKKAGDRMVDRLGMDWSSIRYFFMNVPTKHIADQMLADMRRDKDVPNMEIYTKLSEHGYPGPCAIIHGLDGFLQEKTPQKGDIMFSVVAESSKWMYAGFVFEYLGAPDRSGM
jgi:3-oxoacyl-[acyl-carrier-protein] synthase-3